MAADHPSQALSAYLDDELDGAAHAAVEAHLDGCPECRSLVDDLRRLRRDVMAWGAREAAPPPDLWAAVAARLDAPATAVPPAAPARILPWYRRRISVGVVELAAAAALVAAVTAGLTWRTAPAATTPQAPAPIIAEIEPTEAPDGIVAASFADAQFDAAVGDLEQLLQARRRRLDPRTVLVVERNLQIIDEAIREARAALESDPSNALLNAHLASARQRKLDLLRRAAAITEGD